MSDSKKIKVVYNWIGPVGPTDNNYLPNVFSFAQAFDDTNHYRPQWNADWTWKDFFAHDSENFEICPSVSIRENDDSLFIFPVSLSWRNITKTYFFKNLGIFEISRTPANILNNIKHNNGYVVIDFSGEGNGISTIDFDHMHSYFAYHNIPLRKIIYVTGALNSAELYAEYCSRRGIAESDTNRMNLIPYVKYSRLPEIKTEPYYDAEYVPEKIFLSWNKRARKHRFDLALLLEKHNLVDKSYVSFNKINEETGLEFEEAYNILGKENSTVLEITPEVISGFVSKLPLVLDGETNLNKIMSTNLESTTRSFYQNSLISLVAETFFYENEVFLTEKSFKQIREKHPFIIAGGVGSLKHMRDFGFKTFSDFWDESYDDCKSPVERMQRIEILINTIGQWTPEQILDFKRKAKPIIEYNFKVLETGLAKRLLQRSLTKINDVVTAI